MRRSADFVAARLVGCAKTWRRYRRLISTAHEAISANRRHTGSWQRPGVLKQASGPDHEGRIFRLESLIGGINFSIAKLLIFAQFSFGFPNNQCAWSHWRPSTRLTGECPRTGSRSEERRVGKE